VIPGHAERTTGFATSSLSGHDQEIIWQASGRVAQVQKTDADKNNITGRRLIKAGIDNKMIKIAGLL